MSFYRGWKITIGKYELKMLDSVEITHSVDALSDTAEISLPSAAFNRPFAINDKIKRGDTVTIQLGYDDNLVAEFDGFLSQLPITDNGNLVLKCEDSLFLLRKRIKNEVLVGCSVKKLLTHVLGEIGGFSLNCSYDFNYDKFTIINATGYDVLKKVQEETKANIYLKGNTLHVHPQYVEIHGNVKYDFEVNIELADLKYRNAEDRPYFVTVESKSRDGKTVKAEAGTTGGDAMHINVQSVTDKASLQKLANEAIKTKSYTGYEGTITGWLIPYVESGYQVRIHDADYEYKTGNYYCIEVKTKLSQDGGVRTIKLGKKLSDG